MKTSELTGAALDWAVATCEGIPAEELYIQKWGSRLPPSIYRRNRDEDGKLDGSYTTGPRTKPYNRSSSIDHKWTP